MTDGSMPWAWIYGVDCVALLVYGFSYYFTCYRKGYRIDFWHAQLGLFCVVPYMFMLPFARNELNALVIGDDFAKEVLAVPTVFLIAMAGFFSLYIGRLLWRVCGGIGLRRWTYSILEIGPRCSVMLMASRRVLVILAGFCLCLQAVLLGLYFARSGFGFDLRAYTFANPGIRPLAQITSLSAVIVASHCLARYVDTKEKVLLACTLLLTFGLAFFGQRTNLAVIYMNVILCVLVKRRQRLSLLRVTAWIVGLMAFGFYLGNVRDGLYSPSAFLQSFLFLAIFGNNFSDLRDFSWIYSEWNHHLWLGKTYMAGLATFLPRAASDFRATWTFGVATGNVVGLDTDIHPGLKPGQFGESYFNFGLLGVIASGIIIGLIVRRVDLDVKAEFRSTQPSMQRAFASTMLLNLAGCLSTSLALPHLYALVGLYLLAWVLLQVQSLLMARAV